MKSNLYVSLALVLSGVSAIAYCAWGIGAGASINFVVVGLATGGLGAILGGLYLSAGVSAISEPCCEADLYEILNSFRKSDVIGKDSYDGILEEVGDSIAKKT